MGRMKRVNKLSEVFSKYRYPTIILLIGLLLMLLPGRKDTTMKEPIAEHAPETLEERLEQILSTIEGAGEVRVLLTVAHGEQIVYQTDMDTSKANDKEDIRSQTILITDSQNSENGLVQQVNPPNYLGAVITCTGADDPVVRLSIVGAVSTATGLGADRISVIKMK